MCQITATGKSVAAENPRLCSVSITARIKAAGVPKILGSFVLPFLSSGFPTSGYFHVFNVQLRNTFWGFPGGAVVENLPASAGDTGSSPGLGGSHMPWSG